MLFPLLLVKTPSMLGRDTRGYLDSMLSLLVAKCTVDPWVSLENASGMSDRLSKVSKLGFRH